ncbi:MAG TPA: tetratricopeptide repeat protein [Tepidisphaeraceae bacterium]|nr:tetratricopeptide repeat protein [Tepidisphaeraceae bacterium]
MQTDEALNLAIHHHQSGDLPGAEKIYRQILTTDPNDLDALYLLAQVSLQAGRGEEALKLIRRAIAIDSRVAELHQVLGSILESRNELDHAIDAHRQALALNPDLGAAHSGLGHALRKKGDLETAISHMRQAAALQPSVPQTHYNLGVFLQESGQALPALASYRRSLDLKPDFVEARCQAGALLLEVDDPAAAMEFLNRAIADRPEYAEAHNNLGVAHHAMGRFEEAIASFQRASDLRPDNAESHWNRALSRLLSGDSERGWQDFRRGWPFQAQRASIKFTGPEWDGANLAGKRILIHNQWGAGDAIQMARYLPAVVERGGTIVCMCHHSLHRLLAQIAPVRQWIGLKDPLPPYDTHCSMVGLPAIFGLLPANKPYLRADKTAVAQWRMRVPADDRPKVGIAWANRPIPPGRCPPTSAWATLAQASNAWFCMLQKPIAMQRGPGVPAGIPMVDWTSDLRDFADTAALIESLDLVISVDTAVAHLAAALGKPVWLLLKNVPDWRWMMDRADTPWYSTMRLFRQPTRGDWDTPLSQIVEKLKAGKKAIH